MWVCMSDGYGGCLWLPTMTMLWPTSIHINNVRKYQHRYSRHTQFPTGLWLSYWTKHTQNWVIQWCIPLSHSVSWSKCRICVLLCVRACVCVCVCVQPRLPGHALTKANTRFQGFKVFIIIINNIQAYVVGIWTETLCNNFNDNTHGSNKHNNSNSNITVTITITW